MLESPRHCQPLLTQDKLWSTISVALCWNCSNVFMSFVSERAELCTVRPVCLTRCKAEGKDQIPRSASNTSANADPLCYKGNMLQHGQLVSQELQILLCRSGFQPVTPHHELMLEVSFLPRHRGLHFHLPNCMKLLFMHYSSLLMLSNRQ